MIVLEAHLRKSEKAKSSSDYDENITEKKKTVEKNMKAQKLSWITRKKQIYSRERTSY